MIDGLKSVTVKLDIHPDPAGLIGADPGLAWLTDAVSLVGTGPVVRIDPGAGPRRFERASAAAAELLDNAQVHDPVDLPGTGPVVFGSFTFDPDSPGSSLVIPSTVFGCSERVCWKTTIDFGPGMNLVPVGPPPGRLTEIDDVLSETQWMAAVQEAVDSIDAGELEKVVLARMLSVRGREPLDHGQIVRNLRRSYPGCFTFCYDSLVGASPELLIRRLGDVVDSIPLAGSCPRGTSPGHDARLGAALKASQKNLTEHSLAVQTVVDRLAGYCERLIAEPEPSLLLLANLQHLSTKIQGTLRGSASALELAGALHPTAAVCGVPVAGALQTIRRLEGFERGRYSGPVGWMDRRGDGEWALALRCAELDGPRAQVFAGAGIVAGSDPAAELDETALKLQAVLSALPAINGS
ncbi:MAG: isochorismate synthase [Actinomycetota bacterium]